MIEKIKKLYKEVDYKNIAMFLGITLIFFGIFIIKDYTVDSYLFFQETWREPFFHLMALGRVVTALFWIIFSWTNFNITYIMSFSIAIISTTLSLYCLYNILKKDIKNSKIAGLISVLLVINFCTLELYMFFEKGIMMLSVLMNILAIGHLEEAFKGNKKAYIAILVEMFIANCCYQGTVGLFVAIGVIYIIKNSKTILQFIKNNIIVAFLYAIPALLNFCIVKFIYGSARLDSSIGLAEKIVSILKSTYNIFINTFDILPKYFFLTILFIIGLIYIIKVLMQKDRVSIKLLNIFFLLYVTIAVILAAVAPQILQAYVYMVPRNVFAIGTLIAIFLMLLYLRVNTKKILDTIILAVGIIFLVVLFYNFIDITLDHYYTNKKDMEIAQRIATVIKEYEESTGEKITKVVIYKNNVPTQYKDTRYIGDANVKAFFADWGIRGILDVVLNRQIELDVNKNQEFEEFFNSQDWKEFNEEQIKFIKDTMHLFVV